MDMTIKLDSKEVQLAVDAYLKAQNLNVVLVKVTANQDGEILAECSQFKPTTQR